MITRGVCWSGKITPTISDSKSQDGAGAGTFTSNITNLAEGTTYYVRAYATNSAGTGYGMTLSFKTSGQLKIEGSPIPITNDATEIRSISAKLNAEVNPNNLPTTVTFEYGTSTSYGNSIAFRGNPINGNANSVLYETITSLIRGTTYHFRVNASNSKGTVYGVDKVFTANYGFGEIVAGGYIFYLDATKEHGLVAAMTDQSTGIKWYNGSFIKTEATESGIEAGKANTSKIVLAQGDGNYAAKICDNLVLNGYDDWYLPSLAELSLMFENLKLRYIGNFRSDFYWSSTEDYSQVNAWIVVFDLGTLTKIAKDGSLNVRAVRSF